MMITSMLHQPIGSGSRSVIATRIKIISKKKIHCRGSASSSLLLPPVASSFTSRQFCNESNILRRTGVCRVGSVGRSFQIQHHQQHHHHQSLHTTIYNHYPTTTRRIVMAGQQQRQQLENYHFCQSIRASSSESKKEEEATYASVASPLDNEIGTKNNNNKNSNNDNTGSNDSISMPVVIHSKDNSTGGENKIDDDSNSTAKSDPSSAGRNDKIDKNAELEEDGCSTTTAANENKSPINPTKITEEDNPKPTISFPWRHSTTLPERILQKDDLSHMPNNFQARFVRRLVACKELNMTPFWNAIPLPFGWEHEWEGELANNFATAYGLALEELLGSVFGGKVKVINDEDGITIDSSVKCEDGDGDDDEEVSTKSLVGNSYLNSMFDKKLVERYSMLDSNKCRLKLTIRPMDAKLHSIFAVPLITRDIVEKKPHLKGSYQKIEKEFADSKSYNTVKKMTYDLAEEIGEADAYRRTVIADVLLTCSEYYQLRDLSTGSLLDDYSMEDGGEEEIVVHNVRFEVTTEKGEDGLRKIAGSWKIVDLDDLLEGNVFY